MATRRTIDIDINNNADETVKDFNNLNKAMDQTTKSAKNLDATFEEVYGELQPLTTRMGEAEDRLYELALAGDTTSKEYQELLTKVGQYRKVQIQTDIAVDGAAKTMTEKLGSALTGATSGFALAQGSMAIFGSENEALEKSLLKVQGALAIQQGVKGLSDSYKELQIGTKLASVAQAAYTWVVSASTGALKLFRLALISTGIGAAVVAVGMLVANYEKVTAAIKEATGWFDKQHGAVKALMVIIMPLIGIIKGVMAAAEALGLVQDKNENAAQKAAEADKKRYEAKKKQIKDLMALETRHSNSRIEKLELEKRKAGENSEEILRIDKEINAEKIQNLKDQQNAFREGRKAELKRLEAHERKLWNTQGKNSKARLEQNKINAKKRKQIAEDDFQTITELEDKIRAVRQDTAEAEVESLKERQAKWREYSSERLSIARQIEDLENSLLEDGIDKELEINKVKFERLKADVKGQTEEKKRLRELYQEQEEKAVQKIKDKYAKIDEAREKKRLQTIEEQTNSFLDKIAQIEEDNWEMMNLSQEERELRAVQDKYNTLETLAEDNADALLEIEIARLNEENDIKLKYQNEADAAQKKLDDQNEADAKELQDAKINIAVQGFQLIAGIAEAFAGDDVKRQKRAFQIKKAADIASATVDGYRAVLSTYAQTPGGVVLKTIAATIAGGFAALQIGNIAKAQFQGGDGGSVAASASAGGGGEVSPQFNVVGDSGVNQLAQIQQQPTQAFVVSGEVTTSQALDRNRVQNATL